MEKVDRTFFITFPYLISIDFICLIQTKMRIIWSPTVILIESSIKFIRWPFDQKLSSHLAHTLGLSLLERGVLLFVFLPTFHILSGLICPTHHSIFINKVWHNFTDHLSLSSSFPGVFRPCLILLSLRLPLSTCPRRL